MNKYNLSTIRKFLIKFFDDQELRFLASDYFREVYEDFTTGMRKSQMVEILVEHCHNYDRIPDLMAALQRERERLFPQAFPHYAFDKVVFSPEFTRNPKQIFISHAHQDADTAQRLAQDFRNAGWQVWIAPQSIQPGEKWLEAINRGLEQSGIFLLLVTSAAASSRWVQSETNIAIELEHQRKMEFVPLSIEKAQTPLFWQTYQHIPFKSRYSASDFQMVLNILSRETSLKNVTRGFAGYDVEIIEKDNRKKADKIQASENNFFLPVKEGINNSTEKKENIPTPTLKSKTEHKQLSFKSIIGMIIIGGMVAFIVWFYWLGTSDQGVEWSELNQNNKELYIQIVADAYSFQPANTSLVTNAFEGWTTAFLDICYLANRTNDSAAKLRLDAIAYVLEGTLCNEIGLSTYEEFKSGNELPQNLLSEYRKIYIVTIADAYSYQPGNPSFVLNAFQEWPNVNAEICSLAQQTEDTGLQQRLRAINFIISDQDCNIDLNVAPPSIVPTETIENSSVKEVRIHVVQAGENLFQIGNLYGYTVEELMVYNELNSDILEVGMELRIPPK